MRLCFFISILLFFVACNNEKKPDKIIQITAPQDIDKEVESQLEQYLTNDSIITIDSVSLICYRYFKPNYTNKLLWFNHATITAKGDSLLSYIKHCNYNGLIPNNYHFIEIKNKLDSVSVTKNYINVTALIKTDLLLSDAYYLLGAHLNKGRFYTDSLLLQTTFNKLTKGWDSTLRVGYNNSNIKTTLDSLEPKHYGYRMLKKELANILNNPSLYQMDSIPFVTEKDSSLKRLIVKNLIKQGFYDTTSTENDSVKLVKALNGLQKKWFIQPDGKLGKYTKQALSYNRAKVIKQISMAMERWRWEEPKFPERYAFINIPAFWLTVFEKDTVVMQSAIVCGKPDHQTPILKSKIDHMLIYPYWNVPISIATKEILPAVQRDTTYIRRKKFEVLGKNNVVLDYTKIPWRRYTKDYLP